jgi:superfamily II DNA or RNA helicase
MDNPAYVARKKKGQPTYGIDKRLELYVYDRGDLVVPRGWLCELVEILKDTDYEFNDLQAEGMPADFGAWVGPEPWDDQKAALGVICGLEESGVLVSPAGSGKTNMGLYYVAEKGRCALWLTHTKDLLYQSAERAKSLLAGVGEVGIIGDGKLKWGSGKLIVATVQTLKERPELVATLNDIVGTLVIDEAHHFPAPAFIEVAGQFKAKNFLGITATPNRKDLLEVYLYTGVGPVLHKIERQGLYDTGRLVKPRVEFVYTDFNQETASDRNEINAVDAGGEEMNYTELIRALISDEARAEMLARKIIDTCFKNYSIVITESVRYCYVLRDKVLEIFERELYAYPPSMAVIHGPIDRYTWRAAGLERNAKAAVEAGDALEYRYSERLQRWEVRVEQYTAEEFEAWQITGTQRKEILAQAGAKKIDILFATQLAREGLDMPHLTVGHLAMPKRGDAQDSKNGASVEQEIGRIMRADRANLDKVATWYDYVDYNVGVFQSQYYSRRKVYERLGIKLPKKPRTKRDDIIDFLSSDNIFKGGLPL